MLVCSVPSARGGTDCPIRLCYKRALVIALQHFGQPMISPLTTVAAADRGGAIATNPHRKTRSAAGFWALTLGTIGVVYGDIGTSPLYALREAVVAAVGAGNPASQTVVLGILSLIIWSLILVV